MRKMAERRSKSRLKRGIFPVPAGLAWRILRLRRAVFRACAAVARGGAAAILPKVIRFEGAQANCSAAEGNSEARKNDNNSSKKTKSPVSI